MGLYAPTAVLQGSPQEEVELTTILRLENVNVVGAVSSDANVIFVGRACGEWTVICLEDRSSFVYISQAEDAEFPGGFVCRNRHGESSVGKINIEFTHGNNLIDAASGACTEQRSFIL